MTTILERKRLRTRLMRWAHEAAHGSQDQLVQAKDLRAQFGSDDVTTAELRDAIRFLEGEYLIKAHWVMGGLPSFQLTHRGVVEMEMALEAPHTASKHFVPLASLAGDEVQNENDAYEARLFVKRARAMSADPRVNPADGAVLRLGLDFMEQEIYEASPRYVVVRAVALALREILAADTDVDQVNSRLQWPRRRD